MVSAELKNLVRDVIERWPDAEKVNCMPFFDACVEKLKNHLPADRPVWATLEAARKELDSYNQATRMQSGLFASAQQTAARMVWGNGTPRKAHEVLKQAVMTAVEEAKLSQV